MNGVEVELRVLKATVETGFKDIHRRMDEHKEDTGQRFDQVVDRLDSINGRVGRTAERVGILESSHTALDRMLGEARTRWHELAGKLQTRPHGGTGDEQHLTRAELRYVITIAITAATLGAGITAWAFMQFGK